MAVHGYVNVDEELQKEIIRLRDEVSRLQKLLMKSIDAVTFMEKAMRQLQVDNPDAVTSWPHNGA